MAMTREAKTGRPPGLLTLREAARLTGVRRADLRERIERGEIAVRLVGGGRKGPKLRLTAAALAEAGLLPTPAPALDGHHPGEVAALAEVIREQNARVAALEDQRVQLAGQLGAAVERVLALEAQLVDLEAGGGAGSRPTAAEDGRAATDAERSRAKSAAERVGPLVTVLGGVGLAAWRVVERSRPPVGRDLDRWTRLLGRRSLLPGARSRQGVDHG